MQSSLIHSVNRYLALPSLHLAGLFYPKWINGADPEITRAPLPRGPAEHVQYASRAIFSNAMEVGERVKIGEVSAAHVSAYATGVYYITTSMAKVYRAVNANI